MSICWRAMTGIGASYPLPWGRRTSLHLTDSGRSAWAAATGICAPKPTVAPTARIDPGQAKQPAVIRSSAEVPQSAALGSWRNRAFRKSKSTERRDKLRRITQRKEPDITEPVANGLWWLSRNLRQTNRENGLGPPVILDDGRDPCCRIWHRPGPRQRFKLFAMRREQDGPDIGAGRFQRMARPV